MDKAISNQQSVVSKQPQKTLIGFVVLGGKKLFITVREGQSADWVSLRAGVIEGKHLFSVESRLKKIKGVEKKLASGKDQPL